VGPVRPYAKLAYLDLYGLGNLTKVGRIGCRIDKKMFIKMWCQIFYIKKVDAMVRTFLQNDQA
jgi:hypothetical protein